MAPHEVSVAPVGHLNSSTAEIFTRGAPGPKILDIRRSKTTMSLKDDIVSGMINKPEGGKSLPTMILYSAEGLKLFEEITFLDEYYLTNTEIAILEKYAHSIAERIEDGGIVVELGSGNLRKVNILLTALDSLGKKVTYYALDLDFSELHRTLSLISPDSFKYVECVGLHGTYDDGRQWLKDNPEVRCKSRCILWLGSSIGNFDVDEAVEFIGGFTRDVLRSGSKDCILVGLDGCKDEELIYRAYDDSHGVTEKFILEGLRNVNRILGGEYFKEGEWEYVGQWNERLGRHQAFYEARREICFEGPELKGIVVKKGERIQVEYSCKFNEQEAGAMWAKAGLAEGTQWANDKGDYFLYMLYKPSFFFPHKPHQYAPTPTPTLTEWTQLWAVWDTVTLGMIPTDKVFDKPIDLRNPCIFYLGHIPAFLDMHIARATASPMVGREIYPSIFGRGIDPNVDNPKQCHPHSETPNTWPELDEILEYTKRVREKTRELYGEDGIVKGKDQRIQRSLWLAFEHEAMHLETLLYMLLQSDWVLPPPGVVKPDFVSGRARERGVKFGDESDWVDIPETFIDIGMNDPEDDLEGIRFFGWDNEKPLRRNHKVSTFKTRKYPITNEEYANFLFETSNFGVPASWASLPPGSNDQAETINEADRKSGLSASKRAEYFDNKYVRTVFGLVPLKLASDWPCIASYDELNTCVKWMGGRIPTAEEVTSVYQYVDKKELNEKKLAKRIDAVNGHLINNGVQETPPSTPTISPSRLDAQREAIFADLHDSNVGFRAWTPTFVKTGRLLGRGQTGGAWEWTSSVLDRYEGFQPGNLYPEYTADFFDGKHNIMFGGSWATHPRIAGRKTFVNWFQRNYPYVLGTARIVKE